MRSPEEVLKVLDQAQERLSEDFALRDLMWEVIEDLLDSLGRYAAWEFDETNTPAEIVLRCKNMLTDYVTNNYGDD